MDRILLAKPISEDQLKQIAKWMEEETCFLKLRTFCEDIDEVRAAATTFLQDTSLLERIFALVGKKSHRSENYPRLFDREIVTDLSSKFEAIEHDRKKHQKETYSRIQNINFLEIVVKKFREQFGEGHEARELELEGWSERLSKTNSDAMKMTD